MPGSHPESCQEPARRARRGRRTRRTRAGVCAAAAAGLLLPALTAGPPAGAAGQPQRGSLQQAFEEAAREYEVPPEVLLGVSYLQSRWDTHNGAPSVSGGYGPMHLTDVRAALAGADGQHGHQAAEDARGDSARAARTASAAPRTPSGELPARLRTLERAAQLTGLPRAQLRTSPAANVRGGAALLAAAQRKLGRPLSADPADWYGAVAAYPAGTADASERADASGATAASGTADAGNAAGAAFADEVFDVLRGGEQRTTDSGQRVALAGAPRLRPGNGQLRQLSASKGDGESGKAGGEERADCPAGLSCEWLPAPYEEYQNDDGETDFGNHDKTRRPESQDIDYIVVHSTEGAWDGVLDLVQDPEYVSWNYTLRSSDGHVAQHVRAKDVAWHAGNWYVNASSIGLEHEGFLAEPDAWFTEAMYRSSARLVRYLAEEYDIPLDRQHILGHDNVPGLTPAAIPDMHTDPGPYWDWAHYFALLGEPFTPEAGGMRSAADRERDGAGSESDGSSGAGMVTIRPDYDTHRPEYTECDDSGKPCPPHGSGAVRLHTAPEADAPLVKDPGLHPDGGDSTTGVNDTGARASTGQQYAVAGQRGDWTAIWYLGEKAWFHNPQADPTAVPADGKLVTPRDGKSRIPVYGAAYPEKQAYPEDVPPEKLTPLPYEVEAGQQYVAAGPKTRGAYLSAPDFDPEAEKFQVVRGGLEYYQIQLGHRVAFVQADDVRVTDS